MKLYNQKNDTILKVQQTFVDIFSIRNYQILKKPIFQKNLNENTFELLEGTDNDNVKCIVLLIFSKIGKEKIKKIISDYENVHLIIVSETNLTAKGRQELIGINIETFLIQQVIFNILNHSLQPKFKLLSLEEIEILLCHLHCNLNDFPKMKSSDPISIYFNAKPKDVFEIKRTDGIYYRLVV